MRNNKYRLERERLAAAWMIKTVLKDMVTHKEASSGMDAYISHQAVDGKSVLVIPGKITKTGSACQIEISDSLYRSLSKNA